MNQAILIGRLTKDPDVRRTQDGKAVASYTLAVDRKYAKGDQKADFISCSARVGYCTVVLAFYLNTMINDVYGTTEFPSAFSVVSK